MWSSRKRAVFSVVLSLWAGVASAWAAVAVGQTFPDLTKHGLEGAVPATTGQVVLVDFWASWCAPCKASFPELAAIHRDFSSRGFQIIAVSVDEKIAPYAAWVKKFQSPFVVVRDAAHTLVAEVQAPAMPTSYLLDRHGVVRFVHAGFHGDATVKELRAQITQLLEEKP